MDKSEELTLIDNIQLMYGDVKEKNKMFQVIAKEFSLAPISVKTNWFYSWSIPPDNQARVVEIMQNIIATQNEKKSA